MDRKSLLAILLSTVVVIVFYTFVIPRAEPPEPVASDPAAETTPILRDGEMPPDRLSPPPTLDAPVGDTPRAGGSTPPAAAGLDLATEEQSVTVESDLYKAVFTNRGGEVISFKLKEFDDPFGQWVELLPQGGSELGMVLDTEAGLLDLGSTLFSVSEETTGEGYRRLRFEAGGNGNPRVEKIYTIDPESYLVDLRIRIGNAGRTTGYRIGWLESLPRAEKNPKQFTMAVSAIALLGKNKETIKPKDFKDKDEEILEGNVRWAGVRNKYFMAAMVPPKDTSSRVRATGEKESNRAGVEIAMPVFQGAANHEFRVYLGPMDYNRIKQFDLGLEQGVDLGYRIVRPLSRLLLATMTWLYQFIPNYGIVIILISILTKLIFYPLTKTSVKSMRALQRVQPEMTALREKYKNDNQRLQQEMMGLYKKHKVNPLGGCLPILVQMPVFIALYAVLSNSITMRNADFMLWINDLSSPDTIATIGGFAIHVLPLILTVFTVLQQLLTPVGDPRQKMMGYMMPLVTLFIFYGFPAGLSLYWTVNSVATVAQQWIIHREEPAPAPAPA